MKVISKNRQYKLVQILANFIIHDCQLFSIIESPFFIDLIHELEPGFEIPCIKTMKKIIQDAYKWSTEQLLDMLVSS